MRPRPEIIEGARDRDVWVRIEGYWKRAVLLSYRLPGKPACESPLPGDGDRESWVAFVQRQTNADGALYLAMIMPPFSLRKQPQKWIPYAKIEAFSTTIPDTVAKRYRLTPAWKKAGNKGLNHAN